MTDEPQVDPVAAAGDAQIQDFRTAHNEALLDTGHPEHSRRATELKTMYERRYSAEPAPQFDPVQGVAKPEDAVDEAAADEMRPLPPEKFDIGANSEFGLNVDQQTYGWDQILESDARRTFSTAQLNGAQARTAAYSYYEAIQPTFNVETANRQSTELLKTQYGDQAVERAIAGTNNMLRQLAGPKMYAYIARSGLGSHPRFVGEAVRIAKQRGYWR